MSSKSLTIKPYIQPFERQLALLELEALANCKPKKSHTGTSTSYCVSTDVSATWLAARTAFWEQIADGEGSLITRQVARESTARLASNGKAPAELVRRSHSIQLPKRRCLRYATHGIHEYRGKFFPQLVRSLINVANVNDSAVIGDPMCGSGTTAVEAVLAGHSAQAIDMNPLSVFMTRTKCDILRVTPRRLVSTLESLQKGLRSSRPRKRFHYINRMPEQDQEYLANWFSDDSLAALDTLYDSISKIRGVSLRNFFRLCGSNILRQVSWQKLADLRVRKEIREPLSFREVLELFIAEATKNTKHVVAFLSHDDADYGDCDARQGDARESDKIWSRSCDVVITSPPYATALPYLDTDRLSLIFLGLLARKDHRVRDKFMIGNREISEKARRELWCEFESGDNHLPQRVSDLIAEIHNRNADDPMAGFRKTNLPALLFQYFRDMKTSLAALRGSLVAGGNAFVVVGDNRTVAKGKTVTIPTIDFLRQLAEQVGFQTIDVIDMEMLVSRDIHRRNATPSESIIWLKN